MTNGITEKQRQFIEDMNKEILQKCDSCNNRIKTEAYKEFAEKILRRG